MGVAKLPWFPRATAVAIVAVFVGLNLRGVSEAGGIEIFLVWFKLIVLVVLAGWGLAHWNPPMLSQGVGEAGIGAALFGAASVFMAYEGFQLLTYDYEDIDDPDWTLPRRCSLLSDHLPPWSRPPASHFCSHSRWCVGSRSSVAPAGAPSPASGRWPLRPRPLPWWSALPERNRWHCCSSGCWW